MIMKASRGSRFLCRFLLPATVFSLLLLLGPVCFPEENLPECESSRAPCLGVQAPRFKPVPATPGIVPNECPGQRFQASRLLVHLHSALGPGSEVFLRPYLASWDELIRFMESLGPVVEFFSEKVKSKVSLIRRLAQEDSKGHERGPQHGDMGIREFMDPGSLVNAANRLQHPEADGEDEWGSYESIRGMMRSELSRGVVDFQRESESGCRTLLRLHRSLLWLQLFLKKMAEGPDLNGQLRSPGELCREAYELALAPHHPWLLRRAAEIAFLAMPEWETFFRLVCVQSQAEAAPVLDVVVQAIDKVYIRTQGALQEHGMLELP